MTDFIRITGARENNLKNITLNIPKHQLVVVTGPSGSGKSTLAMDILQRECQRQYMESSGMSSESISKPKVDSIVGLSPSISIGQHVTNRNPRSTVGTVTDMYTYLRLVFQKKGERKCRQCHQVIPPASAGGEEEVIYCSACKFAHPPLTKSDFSFNTPSGACPTCSGLGTVVDIDVEAVFDKEKSIRGGAVTFWYDAINEYYSSILEAAGKHYGFEMNSDQPLNTYSEVQRDLLLYGVESEAFSRHFPDMSLPKTAGKGNFKGVLTGMWQRYKEKEGQSSEAAYFQTQTCHDCGGERLKEESRQVTVEGKTLPSLSRCSLDELCDWLEGVHAKYQQEGDTLFDTVLHDLLIKIKRVINVGLGYLSLDRQTITLSGGESQRLRLASILGSGLTGVLYLLDEPTSGLHPKDTDGLIQVMKELRDLGNTVLLIEHDERVIQEADHIIDVGPGAGRFGGEIVGQGTLMELKNQDLSVTGRYMKEEGTIPSSGRRGNGDVITIHEATHHNLQNVTVEFPLGCLTAVSGVSGSGKSTLVFGLLASANQTVSKIEGCRDITGLEPIQSVINVDQSPLSRMQRSSVSTYVDLYTLLRKTFAALPGAKDRGLEAKHFSFNTPGGRCERCEGLGQVMVDMHFLSHLQVVCPDCKGQRFNQEVLEVTYKDHSISDILELGIEESLSLFAEHKKMKKLLELLCEVGLGYLQWGQSVTTLSGGEAQRLKLAKELSATSGGHTLYLLDEPSTGLHPLDVQKLHVLLNKLVDAGNTVIMVEHNTSLIAASDWVIDMGPGGGTSGGLVVACGSPHDIASNRESHTGKYLFSK
ncbi:excinuclease ABC subunit UvrA [Paenibacillus sp. N3/727]|uniref:excinuclease ABC subunit UvrA n=1 Tax=Paenibacillus sp. N3/727 TaxID=2925845 RepID=UPI001F5306A3|nr:excinuclease ABC subunit UvrA [Paenibacillus sp. N3/727]UNK16375.1 excinuclease ABC subunit UvrA [Paenibacillus sp. N3/727]